MEEWGEVEETMVVEEEEEAEAEEVEEAETAITPNHHPHQTPGSRSRQQASNEMAKKELTSIPFRNQLVSGSPRCCWI